MPRDSASKKAWRLANASVPTWHGGGPMTFLAALHDDRIDAPWFIEGPIDGVSFRTYVEKVLLPVLRPAISSSWTISAATKVSRSTTHPFGRRQALLPAEILARPEPHRTGLRQAQAPAPKTAVRTVDAVCAAIGQAFNAFTPDECSDYLRDSGY
jgi:hypothetical protein